MAARDPRHLGDAGDLARVVIHILGVLSIPDLEKFSAPLKTPSISKILGEAIESDDFRESVTLDFVAIGQNFVTVFRHQHGMLELSRQGIIDGYGRPLIRKNSRVLRSGVENRLDRQRHSRS